MKHTTVSAKKGGKSSKKRGPVRRVIIERAGNGGAIVHAQHDQPEGASPDNYMPDPDPTPFSGKTAMDDAHAYSAGLFNGQRGDQDQDQGGGADQDQDQNA